MTRLFRWWRAHVVLGTVVLVLLLTTGTALAWIVYTGVGGTATTTFGTAPTLQALTLAPSGTPTSVVPCTAGAGASCTGGTSGVITYKVTNNNTVNETWNSAAFTLVTTGHPECDSHLFVTLNPSNTSATGGGHTAGDGIYIPGTTLGQSVQFSADPSTPNTCSAATVTATFTGTTTP